MPAAATTPQLEHSDVMGSDGERAVSRVILTPLVGR